MSPICFSNFKQDYLIRIKCNHYPLGDVDSLLSKDSEIGET